MVLEQWDRASVMLAEMMQGSRDQWSYICQYVTCQIKRCRVKRRKGEKTQRAELEEYGACLEEADGDRRVGAEILTNAEEEGKKTAGGGEVDRGGTSSACEGDGGCEEAWSWDDLR